MTEKMRIMTERPLNAETPIPRLRSWITSNAVFFDRNQGEIPQKPVSTAEWRLLIEGLVKEPFQLTYDQITQMPKAIVSNTLECSGNGRSLLSVKASGNPWTIGGVGNAVWGGAWLRDILVKARPEPEAKHVAFQGMDKPVGSSGVPFIRSIPLEKAMSSTLLAYEMNGNPCPSNTDTLCGLWPLGGPVRIAPSGCTRSSLWTGLTKVFSWTRSIGSFKRIRTPSQELL
jgi:DMSO/TMAO reductase YedYZ molybdopterin-dependent catalytic subunit